MIIRKFEYLPTDVLFEIFAYLSPGDILQSFLSLNKRFLTIIMYQYMWHIHIGGNTMSLSKFKNFCQNVLKLIGGRVISLRITLTNIIGGWSLISSSLNYHQTILLRRLHLIDIEPHEFDKLLRNHVVKQLHTLLVDGTKSSLFNDQVVEGAYLAKVCSCLPALTICRLPFNFSSFARSLLSRDLAPPLMTLPNLSNTIYLHTLTTGINTLCFLEHLLECIPFTKNLSVGVQALEVYGNERFDIIRLPVAVDAQLLCCLSRLSINCMDKRSFHGAIALLSSVFGQLTHLSLKLNANTSISDPLIISGDTIQQLWIDRLKPSAIYTLNLSIFVWDDSKEKIIFNSFVKAPFSRRERPKVFIQERDRWNSTCDSHRFIVYTPPYNETMLPTDLFSKDLEKSCQMLINATDLFPHANKLFLTGDKGKCNLSDLSNCKSSISSLIPWSLLTKISIEESNSVTTDELESILRMGYNVHALEIHAFNTILCRAIFYNHNNLTTRISEQIQSFAVEDFSLTLYNAQQFCNLICNKLPKLKELSFSIYRIYRGQNKSTKSIVNVIHVLVDHLQELVSFCMMFTSENAPGTHCFPNLIRRELHERSLSRPYRLQCFPQFIQIWL